jgi:hypothetical protein
MSKNAENCDHNIDPWIEAIHKNCKIIFYRPFALSTLHHFLLGRVSVGAAAAGAGQPLVTLLVAGVAHGVVVVPPGRLARAGGSGTAVCTLATSLQKRRGRQCYAFSSIFGKKMTKISAIFTINNGN